MPIMNIFEFAARNKLRFPSERGELTVEALWDLPLKARDNFDLDTVAKTINRKIKTLEEESFVNAKPSILVNRLDVKMEIVKHVIAYKLEQLEARKQRQARDEKRERIIAALADKENEAIKGMTPEQLRQQLRELDDEIPAPTVA